MREVDVVVVGAGPAGSAAAITLARAGREVVVIDRARFPRDKCCGDGLTTGALRELDELGLSPASIPSWQTIDACWVRSPSGRTVTYGFPPGPGVFAAVARRCELDDALVQLARAAGAEVADG
jgi:menaquinone-9 beta-reductase